MSNVPPGWYPDPWQQAAQRFWDGNEWTHRVSGGGPRAERPRLAEGAPIYGPFVWIIALLPLLSGILVWFVHIDLAPLTAYVREVQSAQALGLPAPQPHFNTYTLFGPGYTVTSLLGLLSYVAAIVLAYFDQRRLERVGVVRPFQWAWAFLTPIVYVIGRSVIVRRVAAPRGLTPLWVMIGSYVVALISSMVWVIQFVAQLSSQLSQLTPHA
ncbi:DUF2510 domain-containing protein [Gryllotalpicola reticulitermitis]|uniref:DUF2510 domain-containing protein n=1 Tax=Gryllotalpicola reticulitermitis TaxID=1184153 RepID=A0ABV8QD65_9MICO